MTLSLKELELLGFLQIWAIGVHFGKVFIVLVDYRMLVSVISLLRQVLIKFLSSCYEAQAQIL